MQIKGSKLIPITHEGKLKPPPIASIYDEFGHATVYATINPKAVQNLVSGIQRSFDNKVHPDTVMIDDFQRYTKEAFTE